MSAVVRSTKRARSTGTGVALATLCVALATTAARAQDHEMPDAHATPAQDGAAHADDSARAPMPGMPHEHATHADHAPPAQDTDAREHAMPADHAAHSLPPITDADRAAAFPQLPGHGVHDHANNTYLLFDKLEWQNASGNDDPLVWETHGWWGQDTKRLWLRTEGERENSRTSHAEAHLLYGQKISPWWDVVAGIRQDFKPGPAQTFAALGVQGLAPYKLEVEATAYLGENGQAAARLETRYELLITNRLILQPQFEINAYSKTDRQRDIESGFSNLEAALRLRYEIRRELAPYIGVSWNRNLGEAENPRDTSLVAGVRVWF